MVRVARHPSWLRTPHRRLAALALLVALLGVSSAPSPAVASAGGFAYWGGFHVTIEGQSLRIPATQLTVSKLIRDAPSVRQTKKPANKGAITSSAAPWPCPARTRRKSARPRSSGSSMALPCEDTTLAVGDRCGDRARHVACPRRAR